MVGRESTSFGIAPHVSMMVTPYVVPRCVDAKLDEFGFRIGGGGVG